VTPTSWTRLKGRLKSRVVECLGVPIRTCVCCGCKKPKAELIRFGPNDEGELTLDGKGKRAGRGSYICREAECIRAARKSTRLVRKSGRPIPDSVFTELENLVGGSLRESSCG
jgi:predicted RNA-binding protein YlxR (DUF448 family)